MGLIKRAVEEMIIPTTDGKAPVTGSEDNSNMNTHTHAEDLLAPNDVKAAINEAIDAQQIDKIQSIINDLFKAYTQSIDEIVKIVKVQLHDAVMNQRLDEETAIGITKAIDQTLGE